MEPEVLLYLEVFGMIAIAALLTVAIVLDQPVFEGPKPLLPWRRIQVSTAIYCPEWNATAKVTLGLKPATSPDELRILTCDMLREGETCDEPCLEPVLHA